VPERDALRGAAEPARGALRHSVRVRLAAWHTAVLAALLAAFAAAAYAFLVATTRERVDRQLAETAEAFARMWAAERDEEMSAGEAAEEAAAEFQYRDLRVLVHDGARRVVAASPREEAAPPLHGAATGSLAAPLAPLLARAARGEPARATLGGAARVRAYVIPVTMDGRPYTVAVLRSVLEEERANRAFLRALLVAIPAALLLAGAGGYLLARASLAPVVAMGEQAERIGAANLDERLAVANPRDELGRLAGVLNRLLGRLERAFAQQRQFMADASHELRTPVATVRSAADVALARPARPPEEYRDALRVISAEGGRLSRIVDDLFLLARADAGQRVQVADLYLEEVLAECARAATARAAPRGVTVRYDPCAEAPFRGDAALLGRLVTNLLDNAVKHTPRGGEVELSLAREGGSYRVRVRDTGGGVPEAARPFIFDRFFRADAARSRTEGADGADGADVADGAGLGLSIARWVAGAHGGTVALRETGPAGSLFEVTLPAPAA